MGTHPIFESDFDCLTDGTDLKYQWPALRTLINLPSLSLSLTSSRTLAKSRFPHGLTRSKPPPTRSSLPTTLTGTTSDVPPWLATCTCAETPELVLSVKFMEDPRTTDVLLTTSTSLTETSSENASSPSNRSKWSKKSDFRGRVITPTGRRDMDRVAATVAKAAAEAALAIQQ